MGNKQENLLIDGFQFAAVKSGIRGKDRLDIGLIVTEEPADAAAVFTTSLVKAAPVLLGMERIQSGKTQAIMINSGIANACTGQQGMENAKMSAAMVANSLDIAEDLVHVSSTGVIGAQLEMDCFKSVPRLVESLSKDGLQNVAQAIMTTDTVPKTACRSIRLSGVDVKLVGIAKGAGMIMPNMATMLGFIMTDANISADALQTMLRKSADFTFNRITVDGDTSTNDTVMVMASGKANNERIEGCQTAEAMLLQQAITDLSRDLSRQIIADGEGASKLVSIIVNGAKTDNEAEMAARTIANSCLVKTAFFGQDANWGRIIAALGRSGAQFAQEKVAIAFDKVFLVKEGLWLGQEAEDKATKVLQQDSFSVSIDLQAGTSHCEIYTCDLSLDYVKINADYRT